MFYYFALHRMDESIGESVDATGVYSAKFLNALANTKFSCFSRLIKTTTAINQGGTACLDGRFWTVVEINFHDGHMNANDIRKLIEDTIRGQKFKSNENHRDGHWHRHHQSIFEN